MPVPALPADVANIIDRAMALDPGARPSATELADALAGASSQPGTHPVDAVRPPLRWKPWAIGGAALLLFTIIAGTRGGGGEAPAATPRITPVAPDPVADPPAKLHITPPPMADGKAEKDFHKVIDKINRGRYSDAKRKLDVWERKHGGATPETDALRTQLDALGPDRDLGPDDDHGKGHGNKHDD